MSEICSELTIKTAGRLSDVFIVTFKQILNIVLVFLFLTLIRQMFAG